MHPKTAEKLRRRKMKELRRQINRELWKRHRLSLGGLPLVNPTDRAATKALLEKLLGEGWEPPGMASHEVGQGTEPSADEVLGMTGHRPRRRA